MLNSSVGVGGVVVIATTLSDDWLVDSLLGNGKLARSLVGGGEGGGNSCCETEDRPTGGEGSLWLI